MILSNFASLHFSKVPAFLNVTDIAGLVKGASEGQGLGNAFLSHIKACDAIFHLCRKSISPIPPRLLPYKGSEPVAWNEVRASCPKLLFLPARW